MTTDIYDGVISSNQPTTSFKWFPNAPLGTVNSQWFVDPGQLKLYENSSEPGKNMMNITFTCEFDSTTNLAPGPGGFNKDQAIATDITTKLYLSNAYVSNVDVGSNTTTITEVGDGTISNPGWVANSLAGGTLTIIDDINLTGKGLHRYIKSNTHDSIVLDFVNQTLLPLGVSEIDVLTGYVDLDRFITFPELDVNGNTINDCRIDSGQLHIWSPNPGFIANSYKGRKLTITTSSIGNEGTYSISTNSTGRITLSGGESFPFGNEGNGVEGYISLTEINAGIVSNGVSTLTQALPTTVGGGWFPLMLNGHILYISTDGSNQGYREIISNPADGGDPDFSNLIIIDSTKFDGTFQEDAVNLVGKIYIHQPNKYSNYGVEENTSTPISYTDIQTQLQSGNFRIETYMHAWPTRNKDSSGDPRDVLHRFEIIPYWLMSSQLSQNTIIPTWDFTCKCIVREIDRVEAKFEKYWL